MELNYNKSTLQMLDSERNPEPLAPTVTINYGRAQETYEVTDGEKEIYVRPFS